MGTRNPSILPLAAAMGSLALLAGPAHADITYVGEFSSTTTFPTLPDISSTDLAAGIPSTWNGTVVNSSYSAAVLTDGGWNPTGGGGGGGFQNVSKNGTVGRYKIDLGSSKTIGQVNTYSWDRGDNTPRDKQKFTLYGSTSSTDPGFDPSSGWTAIHSVDTTGFVGTSPKYGGTSIYDDGGGSIGTYRWLMWDPQFVSTSGGGENTIFQEFDVVEFVDPEPSSLKLTITPNATTPGNYDFSWTSRAGKVYDLVSDTGLATAPLAWDVYDPDGPGGAPDYGDLPSGGTTTTLENVPGGGDPKGFFAVVEKDP